MSDKVKVRVKPHQRYSGFTTSGERRTFRAGEFVDVPRHHVEVFASALEEVVTPPKAAEPAAVKEEASDAEAKSTPPKADTSAKK